MGEIYTKIFPPYALLIESYRKAQEVATNHEQLDSARAEHGRWPNANKGSTTYGRFCKPIAWSLQYRKNSVRCNRVRPSWMVVVKQEGRQFTTYGLTFSMSGSAQDLSKNASVGP